MSDYQGPERRAFWSIAEVAEFWAVSEDVVYAHVRKGSLPCYKVGASIRIRLLDALQFGVPMNGARRLSTQDVRQP